MNKQHILSEIKRTAQENGGAPLGLDRFLQETGIKYDDWFGKYWARWGDAVKEAGLAPNKFTTEGYGEDVLLEKYALLVRELGCIPTKGDMGLKRRSDRSFPSEKTFRRFGSKTQFLNKLGEYCSNKAAFADILPFIPPARSPEAREDEEVPDHGPLGGAGGSVYLIKVGRHYKIGRTNAIGRREYELAIQLPEKAKTIHVIRTIDDASGIEAYWHRRFEAKRANGEWFELDSADVQAFKRRTLM